LLYSLTLAPKQMANILSRGPQLSANFAYRLNPCPDWQSTPNKFGGEIKLGKGLIFGGEWRQRQL
jgi:hypothetical protein